MKTNGLIPSACLLLLFVWPASSQVRLAWSARFAGSTNSMNSPVDMAADSAGNVYVTGSADSTTATNPIHQDYCTVKFAPDGSLQWAHRYRGGTNGYNVPRRIKLGSDGNLYVVGYSATNHVAFQAQQIATVKYSPNGAVLWASRQGIVGENYPYSLAVDSHGSAYITGLGNAASGSFFL